MKPAVSEPRYVFSISQHALRQQPWRKGMVYLLPRDTFVNQPSIQFGPYEIRVPQLASLVPVKPFGQLEVIPEDFPFLKYIRGMMTPGYRSTGRPCRLARLGLDRQLEHVRSKIWS